MTSHALSVVAAAAIGATVLTAPVRQAPPITKLIVIVEENATAAKAQQQMPYLDGLATTYGHATHYSATAHPSLPNYLELSSGTTHGVTADGPPKRFPIHGPDVFDDAITHGRTARVYADETSTNCQTTDGTGDSQYRVRHIAWPYYVDHPTSCAANDVPASQITADINAGNLPNVGWLIGALDHDGHKPFTLSDADHWLAQEIPPLLAGPDYASGHLAILITFDEGAGTNQTVDTVVIAPTLDGRTVTTQLDHHSTWVWQERLAGNPQPGADTGQAFGL